MQFALIGRHIHGKRAIIQGLLQEYDIQNAQDIQDALKDLLGGTIKEMMEAEIDDHLGYEKSEWTNDDSEDRNYRNGYKSKRVNSSYGSMDIDVPQDRNSSFEPKIVKKRQKDISDIDQKIISMYAKGMTTKAITTAYPETEQQRCIVHMVRNTLKYVANKGMKEIAKDLKTVYTAVDEEAALEQLERVKGKWSPQYPYAMKRWYENWDAVSPIFKFSADVRKAFYTTNTIESLNATLRRLNRQRSVFPCAQALLKALYLATFEASRKWTMPIRNWGQILGELAIMYPDRIPE